MVQSANDYYPFGWEMPDRKLVSADGYRFGFNGMEKEPEVSNGHYDTEFRKLDTRIGRWLSVDQLASFAPDWTPYRFGFNNPILYTDILGLFEDKKAAKKYAKKERIYTGWFSNNKINKNSDGSWSIDNKKEHSSISDLGGDLGVLKGALAEKKGVHLREIALDHFNDLSNPYSERYNPNAVVQTDLLDIAYFFGHLAGFAMPTARLATGSKAARSGLLDELTANGIKHSADDILHIGKNSSGKIIFLEKGTSKAGFNHDS